jgi:hypothetical protein
LFVIFSSFFFLHCHSHASSSFDESHHYDKDTLLPESTLSSAFSLPTSCFRSVHSRCEIILIRVTYRSFFSLSFIQFSSILLLLRDIFRPLSVRLLRWYDTYYYRRSFIDAHYRYAYTSRLVINMLLPDGNIR